MTSQPQTWRAERWSARPSCTPSEWTTRMSISDDNRPRATIRRRVRHLPWTPCALDLLSDDERADLLAALAEGRVEVTVEESQ